ncbi:MAG: glycosyltransferase involved in cell wall biosynthesis [Crocinitomicaceae bacterium]|jgi:glycosyltransferase involved in cell wall biosynthesis
MKKLLVIGYVWPEPNSSAAGSRMLQLIQSFQMDGYVVTFSSPAKASEHAIDFEAANIEPVTIELNSTRFDDFIINLSPNVVLFDRFMMEEQFAWRVEKYCPLAIRVLDTEDLHCLRFARQTLAKGNSNVIQKVPKESLFSEYAKREVAAILRCDLNIMISEYEIDLLISTFNVPSHILAYVPFMLDIPSGNITALGLSEREHFVSIGNFRHEPNWDAVLILKQHIWPLIRKELPKAQLHIYGAYPPKKATQLHNEKQGFLVKGWCENAFEVLRQGRVLLAPLRFGAGLKGKMLDAAQCGLPAVTTSIGAEGLYADKKNLGTLETCLAIDDLTKFAQHAINLYENEELWHRLQANGPAWLRQRFSKKNHEAEFLVTLNNVINKLDDHRLNNFTGSMLLHHSMKSTQYMAQWIEAKNN